MCHHCFPSHDPTGKSIDLSPNVQTVLMLLVLALFGLALRHFLPSGSF